VRRTPLALLLATAFAACTTSGASPDPDGRTQLVVRTGEGRVVLEVEVADTPEERSEGLMGRTSLPPDAGMAFVWPGPTSGSFWMKDTRIPLSIAFWDADGRIVAILDMEPCPADPCPTYDPGVEFAGAVEANQGFFEEHGIRIGDHARLLPEP
jgi:hypothetical protein